MVAVNYSLIVDKDLLEKAKAIADKENRTLAGLIRNIIEIKVRNSEDK